MYFSSMYCGPVYYNRMYLAPTQWTYTNVFITVLFPSTIRLGLEYTIASLSKKIQIGLFLQGEHVVTDQYQFLYYNHYELIAGVKFSKESP